MNQETSHYFTTSDNAKLHYLLSGTGEPLIMLPGAGLSAGVFKYQIDALSSKYQVIALDKRGHGKSEKVSHGYRISRFAHDLNDLLQILNIDKATLLCHSLGASMVYNYIDLFGTEKINKLIIVDEPPALLINPVWSTQECEQYGAIYSAADLHSLTNNFITQDTDEFNRIIIDKMTTPHATAAQKSLILSCMQIPGSAAATLYFNNICQDFRDVMQKINIPTLFITGKASLHPWQSHQWMHKQVQNSKLVIFEENEGGSHFMFVENPDRFNQVLSEFLD